MNKRRAFLYFLVVILWLPLIIPNFTVQRNSKASSTPVQVQMQARLAAKLWRLADSGFLPQPTSESLAKKAGLMLEEIYSHQPQATGIAMCAALGRLRLQNLQGAADVLQPLAEQGNTLAAALLQQIKPDSPSDDDANVPSQQSSVSLQVNCVESQDKAAPLADQELKEQIDQQLEGYYKRIALFYLNKPANQALVGRLSLSSQDLKAAQGDLAWLTLSTLLIFLALFTFIGFTISEAWRLYRKRKGVPVSSSYKLTSNDELPNDDALSSKEALPSSDVLSNSEALSSNDALTSNEELPNSTANPAADFVFDPLRVMGAYVGLQWLMIILGVTLTGFFKSMSSVVLRVTMLHLTLYTIILTLLALLVGKLRRDNSLPQPKASALLGFKPLKVSHFGWGFVGFSLALVTTPLLAALSAQIWGHSPMSNNPFLLIVARSQPAEWLFIFLQLSLLGPFFEESVFRGLLFGGLRQSWGVWLAGLVSAVVFSLMHSDPQGMIVLAGLGGIFAFLYQRNGNLWPSIIAHGFWNGFVVLNMVMIGL